MFNFDRVPSFSCKHTACAREKHVRGIFLHVKVFDVATFESILEAATNNTNTIVEKSK